MELSTIAHSGDVTIIHLKGRLDLLTSGSLKQYVQDLLEAGQLRLVFDLEEVSFIDSSGLGVIIGCMKAARRVGGGLHIARPAEQARVILELTMLNRVLHPYQELEEAIASLESAHMH